MLKYLAGYVWHCWSVTVHKFYVAWFLHRYCQHRYGRRRWHPSELRKFDWQLRWRALTHDLSKYRWSEAHSFADVTFALWRTTYGTDEYRALLKRIKPAIDLHYRRNRHHPEHFGNGIRDMQWIDTVEMLADWCAAVRRHRDGDIYKSLEINSSRFNYDPHLNDLYRRIVEVMLGQSCERVP